METFPFSVSGNYTIIVGGPRTMVSECVVQGVGSKRRKKKIGKNRTVLYTECSQGSTVDVVCSSKGFLFAYKFNPRRSWYTLYCSARSTNFYSDPSAQRAPAHTTYSTTKSVGRSENPEGGRYNLPPSLNRVNCLLRPIRPTCTSSHYNSTTKSRPVGRSENSGGGI